jgi:hypothetical protein
MCPTTLGKVGSQNMETLVKMFLRRPELQIIPGGCMLAGF